MKPQDAYLLIEKYFEENSFVASTIESFNEFVSKELQNIIDENKFIEPTILPPNVESYKIRFDRVLVGKPEIIEADGSRRIIFPAEARLRKLTYAAPIFLEISTIINDIQRETTTIQICNLPIMLKSKYCNLYGLSDEELIEKGEDPRDVGGYFIINGTERVLVTLEDLAPNRFIVEEEPGSKFVGKIFSERGPYKIPHTLEKLKDGILSMTWTRIKRAPVLILIKALGLIRDEEIVKAISEEKQYDEILINLFEFAEIKKQEDALDWLARAALIPFPKEERIVRMEEMLDKYFLPHVGITKEVRIAKAINLCKLIRKFLAVVNGEINSDDKDHYSNKRLKMAGESLIDLFRTNFKVLINDMLYNFQRLVKRGKFPLVKMIVREKLLTNRIYSAMATGNWVAGRKGISQRLQRLNFLNLVSHLQRVVSPLSTEQENFSARELHPTQWGRLCPNETPEGISIGLRKNLALLAYVTREIPEEEVLVALKNAGMQPI